MIVSKHFQVALQTSISVCEFFWGRFIIIEILSTDRFFVLTVVTILLSRKEKLRLLSVSVAQERS